jgi:U3 small nucleolar RNA-associated protein 4
MSTALSAHVLVVDLGDDKQQPTVCRKFNHHRRNILGGRVVKNHKSNNNAELSEDEDITSGELTVASVLRLAISTDGQWLASSDDHGRTHVFNLDSVQVRHQSIS